MFLFKKNWVCKESLVIYAHCRLSLVLTCYFGTGGDCCCSWWRGCTTYRTSTRSRWRRRMVMHHLLLNKFCVGLFVSVIWLYCLFSGLRTLGSITLQGTYLRLQSCDGADYYQLVRPAVGWANPAGLIEPEDDPWADPSLIFCSSLFDSVLLLMPLFRPAYLVIKQASC